jgi:hypothetical protein
MVGELLPSRFQKSGNVSKHRGLVDVGAAVVVDIRK